jgi:hypothetical protein
VKYFLDVVIENSLIVGSVSSCMDSVITESKYKNVREQLDEVWTNFEVFEEERDPAPLREIVLEVVEGQYTHPAGPDSVYGMEGSADSLVWDKVISGGLVPDGIPDEVREQFARDLAERVRQNATSVYKSVRTTVDPEEDSFEEIRQVIQSEAEATVPETY